MGWRYVYFTAGAVILMMSVLRVVVIRFHETPKFSLCQGKDEQVVATLSKIARDHNRPFSLTVEQLQACGTIKSAHASQGVSFSELAVHYKGLFLTRKTLISTILVWLSWTLIGLAYPLFYIFLPEYLASRGADFGNGSAYTTWRNYAITNAVSIVGPVIASFLCRTRLLGRRYTMVIGGLISSQCHEDVLAIVMWLANPSYSGVLVWVHCRTQCWRESRHFMRHWSCHQCGEYWPTVVTFGFRS